MVQEDRIKIYFYQITVKILFIHRPCKLEEYQPLIVSILFSRLQYHTIKHDQKDIYIDIRIALYCSKHILLLQQCGKLSENFYVTQYSLTQFYTKHGTMTLHFNVISMYVCCYKTKIHVLLQNHISSSHPLYSPYNMMCIAYK